MLGTESGHYSLEKADLVFLLGTDFPYTAWYPKGPKIVQLDIRAEHLGRRSKLELGLMGDVKETLRELLPLVKQKRNDKHLKACLERHRDTEKSLDRPSPGYKAFRFSRP
jgi:thiamine pyrophosphate-dependent acetolactate synthase large subunit-like protein